MEPIPRAQIRKFQQSLLDWFEVSKRDLPWRRNRNPYVIWVSEIMLQQTQVATVVPYFERWLQKYPSIAALAKARESDVLKAWEGLGYYSRARNLMRGAQRIMARHAGKLPSTVDELLQIPGIGRYTAGAIASLAFDRPEPALDGNVMRVLCRVWDIAGDPRRSPLQRRLWSMARQLATGTDTARLNEGLMELGALMCTPQTPKCSSCPLRRQCRAYEQGRVEQRPQIVRSPSGIRKQVQILIARRGASRVLVHKRDRTMTPWANLWTFPFFETRASGGRFAVIRKWLSEHFRLKSTPLAIVDEGKYSITRFSVAYAAVEATLNEFAKFQLPESYLWVNRKHLDELVMPAPHRRLAKAHVIAKT